MGRHRHAVAVRTDGLAAVLGPLFFDPRIRSAALLDVDSGMVLDVCGPDTAVGRTGRGVPAAHDHRDEVRGAAHAELVRIALALAPNAGGRLGLVLEAGPDRHVLRTVADPHGGRLALSVVVRGPDRAVRRVRKLLEEVSDAALTAGPSTAVRPGSAGWAATPATTAPVPDHPGPVPPTTPAGRAGAAPASGPPGFGPPGPSGFGPPDPPRFGPPEPPGFSPPGPPPRSGPMPPSALPAGPPSQSGPPSPRPPLPRPPFPPTPTPAAAGDPAAASPAER